MCVSVSVSVPKATCAAAPYKTRPHMPIMRNKYDREPIYLVSRTPECYFVSCTPSVVPTSFDGRLCYAKGSVWRCLVFEGRISLPVGSKGRGMAAAVGESAYSRAAGAASMV